MMRLRTEIWIKAYIRRCTVNGAMAVVVRHGDDDAGAVYIRINRLDGTSLVFGPAPAGLDNAALDRQWVPTLGLVFKPDLEVDRLLSREVEFDPDIWILEVEDRDGRHFLDGWLAQ
jgi:hypothetical protein